ncbi:lipid II:glycine glycyltransferase FemX [Flavobacterium sp.]|uniref:lipid II:glycine glycyltransferase FemX n=1 Tax=Flavobacterium sp. TaxID=239 RepID=UPI0039E265BC
MEIIFTKETQWLQKWDDFVLSEDKASHLMLAQWNATFSGYGFDFEVGILQQDGQIHGGFAAVVAKAAMFRFYVVPYGPIVSEGFEKYLDELVAKVPQRARFWKCCYAHVSLPVAASPNRHVYPTLPELPSLVDAKPGQLFKYVYSGYGLNWVDLRKADSTESLLEMFKSTTRRDIRSAERKGLELRFLETADQIKLGYDLCLQNAEANQYSIRDWHAFGPDLIAMVNSGMAKFLGAFHEGDLKGAVLLLKGGNYYTYILGGSKRQKPDLLAGHFLQWQAIRFVFSEGCDGYNISLGGSAGVINLKNSFADVQIVFENSKYHWVISPFYLKCYMFVESKLKRHKKTLARLFSVLKRKS